MNAVIAVSAVSADNWRLERQEIIRNNTSLFSHPFSRRSRNGPDRSSVADAGNDGVQNKVGMPSSMIAIRSSIPFRFTSALSLSSGSSGGSKLRRKVP
jgi:hypothetical protein